MRKRLLLCNTVVALLNQIIAIICGFVLPYLILQSYGSEINGLLSSITQFLSVITFLEMGVGAVVQSSLYLPLASSDEKSLGEIISSSNQFFHRIAYAFVVYIIILAICYPKIVNNKFDTDFTVGLIVMISLSIFAQYYFGIVNQLLLNASQRSYIVLLVQSGTLILNTLLCSILILSGQSIIVVKMITSLVFLLRPIILQLYVQRHFNINNRTLLNKEPLKQKWNGLAQHIAAVTLNNTDSIVLTLFSTLSNVSIYAIYYFIIYGVKTLLLSLTNGLQALLGDMIAKKESEKLAYMFGWVEWLIHSGSVVVFGCVGVLIVPFVQVYTIGIHDANYNVPLFAILLTAAHGAHCLRLPYNLIVLGAGHYKQTQSCYIIATIVNISISIIFVKKFGLIGVTIGTLIAMIYQTLWLAFYDSHNIVYWPMKNVLKQFGVDILCVISATVICLRFCMVNMTYKEWGILAIKVLFTWCMVSFFINTLFYHEKIQTCKSKLIIKFANNMTV